ncbi:MAG: YihY/virulence factor BrkB family protein [Halovenus sp.]
MNDYVERTRQLLDTTTQLQLPFLAAAIAYYAFVSVLPLLLIAVAVASFVAGPAVAAATLDRIGAFLTPEATSIVKQTLVDGTGRGGTTLLGLVVLSWSSLRVFRGLDIAFDRIYGEEAAKPLLEQIADAGVTVVAIAAAVAVTGVASAFVPIELLPFPDVLGTLLLPVTLPAVFFPLYYVLPPIPVSVREALPGAVVAGFGWALLGVGFGIYAARAGSLELYGVVGGVLLLLVWFYFAGLLLLLGAGLNALLVGRLGDRQLQQAPLREGIQATMDADGSTADEEEPSRRADAVTQAEIDELRRELDEFEAEIDERTVHREELERDLRQYVRNRMRRGHARGWGPYLVLLYGTVMTVGAFNFLGGGWAILAMLIIWLSTLGLYALMLIVGFTVAAIGLPGRVIDRLRNLR